ncbi:hypothetical protein [Leisingera sp. S232]|uniref:hypothetical protein n=1 Tax=Leisingera sp. S232 TaxID=3415132 RepID=UPI00086D7E84|nr:hypothetical protein AB838_09000 [Rhodobacteraceae bacterium (ex Bugula neritina AB1)]
MANSESFEKFYFKKVGLGEGCGCAERVIDNHEFDRLSGRAVRKSFGSRFSLRAFALKYGLISRRHPAPDAE